MKGKLIVILFSLFACGLCSVGTHDFFRDSPAAPSKAGPTNVSNPVDVLTSTTSTQAPKIETTTEPPKTTTSTEVPKTTTSTEPPKTTTSTEPPKTTTSTEPPKTTTSTEPPKTTTSTEPPKTTTSTEPPKTTTLPPATTTVAPTAVGPVKVVVKDSARNVTCIVAQMLIGLNIRYPTVDNKTASIPVEINNATAGVSTSGVCGNATQSLKVAFGGHSLNLTFGTNATTKEYYISGVILSVNASGFPNVSVPAINETGGIITYVEKDPLFKTPLKMSYKCSKVQSFNLTSNANWTTALNVSDTQIEAFRNVTDQAFGDAQDCEPHDTPDIVPIAVGCALATLVIVVLVAYLIGRRKTATRGYVSM